MKIIKIKEFMGPGEYDDKVDDYEKTINIPILNSIN